MHLLSRKKNLESGHLTHGEKSAHGKKLATTEPEELKALY